MRKKIIMLVGKGESSRFMYNSLKGFFQISKVIIEDKANRKRFLKRRIKNLGYLKVFGQVLFQLIVPKILERISQNRIKELKSYYKLDSKFFPKHLSYNVSSVNTVNCIEIIKKEKPDLIIVNGTRIISKKVLDSTNAIFINTDAGITPKYRGVHGGYWAIVNEDKNNCGVTVHLVDRGIDTGSVLFQQKILTTTNDNFTTYTYLQIGEGIIIMKKAIDNFINNQLEEVSPNISESKLWYHPTIWFYIYKKLTKGVK